MSWLGIVGGIWGLATIALLIPVIRYSYAAERRSYPEKFEGKPPRRANVIAVAFNFPSIARDAETQALRRKMNRLLLIMLALFVVMAVLLFVAAPTAAPA